MSKSLLYPFGKKNKDTSFDDNERLNNSLHDLQIDSIIRLIYIDANKQKKILDIFSNLCTDKETILYRQSCLRDMMFNRNLYYGLGKICVDLDKCFTDYNAIISARLKVKSKGDISLTDASMTLRDYAFQINKLISIYRKMHDIFSTYAPSSQGLKELASNVAKKVTNKELVNLEKEMTSIINSAFAYSYSIELDDKLYPKVTKYIVCNGKYTGEKFTFFKRKDLELGRVDINDKVKDDFKSISLDAYNRVVVIIEDIFESLYEEVSYISREYIYFEFGIFMYDMLGERRVYCTFPTLSDKTEYQGARDPYLLLKYIAEGYSHPVYGNNITISNKQSVLVVGPNNTGKTVFLRTVGIYQIFGQAGYFLPCDVAEMEIKDDVTTIFSGEEKDTDVGGRFEKEVIDIKDIIDKVNSKSLVIINEIFQSTFAKDGQKALFDILNYFSEIDVSWICVTHLIGILDDRTSFTGKTKTYTTSTEVDKYKIKEI